MGEFYYRPPDELYHYGVKGMRWGVRKEPYTKEQIRQRRNQLIKQAPNTKGERGDKGYWRGASDAQIARLMDYEAKEAFKAQRKANKKPMSTAKKVAIGVGVAAAVAGVTYAAVKTGQAQKIAKRAAKLVNRNKTKTFSDYELRKMGISTFKPDTFEVTRGTQVSAAKQSYYQRHGKVFVSSYIKKPRKIQGYSNKNYTDLGRAHYKVNQAQSIYDRRLKLFKKASEIDPSFNKKRMYPEQPKTQKEILSDMVVRSRNRVSRARVAEQQAVNRAYAKKSFKRTKSINYRNLTRKH